MHSPRNQRLKSVKGSKIYSKRFGFCNRTTDECSGSYVWTPRTVLCFCSRPTIWLFSEACRGRINAAGTLIFSRFKTTWKETGRNWIKGPQHDHKQHKPACLPLSRCQVDSSLLILSKSFPCSAGTRRSKCFTLQRSLLNMRRSKYVDHARPPEECFP